MRTEMEDQSIIDRIRTRIYAKSIFERPHEYFDWFLLSQRFQNSISLNKIVFETLSVLRMRLETHLIRF